MSVFDRMFKLKTEDYTGVQREATINLLMQVTHNKLSKNEIENLYSTLTSKIIGYEDYDSQVKESMKTLTTLKSDWLSNEEKENFVTAVWLCERGTDSTSSTAVNYINPEELKYTKQTILGSSFKSFSQNH